MPTQDQVRKQTEYLQALYKAAEAKALDQFNIDSDSILFDPQGRLLIDVAKPEGDFTKTSLGFNATETTTVSLDVSNIDILKEEYEKRLKSAIKQELPDTSGLGQALLAAQDTIYEKYDKTEKGSIIALHEEAHFNLSLAKRAYGTLESLRGQDKKIDAAFKKAIREVNARVNQIFAKALIKATKNGTQDVDISLLNESLDAGREAINAEFHDILATAMHSQGLTITEMERKTLKKKLTSTTTASDNDLVVTDESAKQVHLLTGTEQTAHHRTEESLADVQIIVHTINNGTVSALERKTQSTRVRVPSLDLKKGKVKADILAVANKFALLQEKYFPKETLLASSTGRQQKQNAFIYNLFTSRNDISETFSDGKNKQTRGAEVILKGAHAYNKTAAVDKNPLAFVQNIAVNGFGDTLGYDYKIGPISIPGMARPLKKEATLMAEMAMLHTLYDQLPKQEQETFNQVIDTYKMFLTSYNPDAPSYFSASKEGKQAIQQIQAIKRTMSSSPRSEDTPLEHGKRALMQLMKENKHLTHDYAKLAQSLSVFVEEASIGGCKSANERAQHINGRVDTLSELLTNPASKSKSLRALRTALEADPIVLKTLNKALDNAYNERGLSRAASKISLRDQGGAAKLERRKSWFHKIFGTNLGESSQMKNLYSAHAGATQAHKGSPKAMNKAAKRISSEAMMLQGLHALTPDTEASNHKSHEEKKPPPVKTTPHPAKDTETKEEDESGGNTDNEAEGEDEEDHHKLGM